jgi:TonB family protein
MLIALGLLLAALVVVVVKDREFWFPSAPEIADDSSEDATPATSTPVVKDTPSAPQTTKSKGHAAARAEHEHISGIRPSMGTPNMVTPSAPPPAEPAITTNRAALPPLEVEVVAGGQHTVLQPNNHSVKVDLQSGTPGASVPGTMAAPSASAASVERMPVTTNAGERVRLSPDTAQMVEHPVQPNYPMLAKEMKVQGSVVLQALIGQEGSIQDLRVLSGPAILSTAAMDAVRQWRFRPYFQSGQPVETEARITVNFTISTN